MKRSNSKTVTFAQPFVLRGLDGVQPAGNYTVETDDDFLETVLSPTHRRRETVIHLGAIPGNPAIDRTAKIDPEELDAALSRDAAQAETHAERPTVSLSRRQAHRVQKKALTRSGIRRIADSPRHSPEKEIKSAMADHKFKAGQTVTVVESTKNGPNRTGYGLTPHGKFQIVQPLPAEQGQNQYRIKSNLDGHERVVRENELT